jgi:polysaccharide export outer membrane protein
MAHKIIKNILLFITISLSLLATSCISQKEITYFQTDGVKNDSVNSEVLPKYILRLKTGNIISVGVSSISPESNIVFNPYLIMQPMNYQSQQTNNIAPAIGYLIDEKGAISVPMAGKIVVAGLNTSEAGELIALKLEKYLINPTVNVRMLNYSVSVLGEVNKPSVYTIPNERITLPELISLAGDLTIFAQRNNVLVIREVNGKRQFARVDMTKRDLFSSPYFYLQPNDVVYVEPGKGKKTTTDRAVQLAPTVISSVSLLVVLLSIIFK